MLKQIAWNTFKTTGNINTMLELLEVDKTMEDLKETKEIGELYKNKNGIEKEEKKWEL